MSPNTVAHTQAEVARLAARHALGWLVAANAVGVLLAALLLRPGLNVGLGAFTFGRWVPLHLDWQLYGWCALPLVAALLAWCFDPRHPQAIGHARLALGAWSLALVLGGVSWLGGSSSGKPFLEWSGWARPVLPWAMAALWSILAAHTWWRRAEAKRWWGAAFGWWAALVASGIWTFLPGISERLKYTNAMVGHAHLAMAGLVTSANMAVLIELRGVGATRGYWFWQAACALHVAVLVALGFVETGHTADLYLGTPWTQAIYAVRLGTGAVMLLVAVWWWRDAGGEKGARSGR